MRLALFLTHAGLCSRRKADELIHTGQISINHWIVKDPTHELKEKETVRYNKQIIKLVPTMPIYIILYKPAGCVTTAHDTNNRPTVIDLLGKTITTRIFPIGRLDVNTTGALLLTNDGDLAHKLAHPKYEVQKTYQVTLNRQIPDKDITLIKRGLHLPDGFIKVDNITIGHDAYKARVAIHSGRNRIVRRIFETLGYTVTKLERISFAGISKRGLSLGQWRHLTNQEINKLKK